MSTPHQREIRKLLPKKRKLSPAKRVRNTASVSATPGDSKRKRVKAVSTEGKENTVSDGEHAASASPPSPSKEGEGFITVNYSFGKE
ncbi:MAG TPA: hypothetical protein VGO47_08180 [Chlamydiales bacterium]|nr:hypothetical protein [Chlamydiales bacterium]